MCDCAALTMPRRWSRSPCNCSSIIAVFNITCLLIEGGRGGGRRREGGGEGVSEGGRKEENIVMSSNKSGQLFITHLSVSVLHYQHLGLERQQ